MRRHAKTQMIMDEAHKVLEDYHPMTVRQVYYRLVSQQLIKNTRSQYQSVSRALVLARQEGAIPWDWIEDRLRRPRGVNMWHDLSCFIDTVKRSYRRNVWQNQDVYIECWLEKDALSGIFMDVLGPYGVTLNVGRGYDGWSSIRNAADRLVEGADCYIQYYGDLDPSGRDIARSLGTRLEFFDCYPEIEILALTPEDIETYNLPPDFTKATDSRSGGFVAEFGDIAVELDALPIDVLKDRIAVGIEVVMDLEALKATREEEQKERRRLGSMFG